MVWLARFGETEAQMAVCTGEARVQVDRKASSRECFAEFTPNLVHETKGVVTDW